MTFLDRPPLRVNTVAKDWLRHGQYNDALLLDFARDRAERRYLPRDFPLIYLQALLRRGDAILAHGLDGPTLICPLPLYPAEGGSK